MWNFCKIDNDANDLYAGSHFNKITMMTKNNNDDNDDKEDKDNKAINLNINKNKFIIYVMHD